MKQIQMGAKPEIFEGDQYEQGGLPEETQERGLPYCCLGFLFLVFIVVLLSISFCLMQAIKLTSQAMAFPFIITGIAFFIDFIILRPIFCLIFAFIKAATTEGKSREEVKLDMGMI